MLTLLLTLTLIGPQAASQQPWYRPLSLADMVKAVGTNPEGMPPDDLPRRITTYALHIGSAEGVGVSVRFADDPAGAILAGWRTDNDALWRWGWIEQPGLGKLESYRPVDGSFVIETHHPDRRITSVVLSQAIETLVTIDARVESVTRAGTALTLGVVIDGKRRVVTCAVGSPCRY